MLKIKNTYAFIIFYWGIISVNTYLSSIIIYSTKIEWWINTILMLAIVVLCLQTFIKRINWFYKAIAIPTTWLAHAIISAPVAIMLGIIKFDPENIRRASEHRAVFILSSIPILLFYMNKSSLFINQK